MAVQRKIKIPYALKDGALVHVSQVTGGLHLDCLCPNCRGPMVARKGPVTAHHFAHHRRTDCRPETVLHLIGKKLLHVHLEHALKAKRTLPVRWRCRRCGETHEGNLLKKARKAALEMTLGDCRPDIALLDREDRPIAIIEIVVTHEPEDRVYAFCRETGTVLVLCRVRNETELEKVKLTSVFEPDSVDLCLKPRCRRCGEPLYAKKLMVYPTSCWRCGRSMKMALLDVGGKSLGPEDFSARDRRTALDNGVYLKLSRSLASPAGYLASACPHCQAFIGSGHVHEHRVPYGARSIQTGYCCVRCGGHQEGTRGS